MKKFDVSWKFIVLIIVLAMFLLSALDLVVHGATTKKSDSEIFLDRWDKLQAIEDRAIKVFKEEEDDDNIPESIVIWGISREFETEEESTYKYTLYYADGTKESDTITLDNTYVDAAWILYTNIEDDVRWIDAMTILAERYE